MTFNCSQFSLLCLHVALWPKNRSWRSISTDVPLPRMHLKERRGLPAEQSEDAQVCPLQSSNKNGVTTDAAAVPHSSPLLDVSNKCLLPRLLSSRLFLVSSTYIYRGWDQDVSKGGEDPQTEEWGPGSSCRILYSFKIQRTWTLTLTHICHNLCLFCVWKGKALNRCYNVFIIDKMQESWFFYAFAFSLNICG